MEAEEKLGGRRKVGSQGGRAAAAQGGQTAMVRPPGGHLGARDGAGEGCGRGTRASGLDVVTDRGKEGARVHHLDVVSPGRVRWRGSATPRSTAR